MAKGNARPRAAPNDAVLDSEAIGTDLSCFGCGYNLRTLSPQAHCPECGYAVSASVRTNGIGLGTSPCLKKLSHGLALIALALLSWHLFQVARSIEVKLLIRSTARVVNPNTGSVTLAGGARAILPRFNFPAEVMYNAVLLIGATLMFGYFARTRLLLWIVALFGFSFVMLFVLPRLRGMVASQPWVVEFNEIFLGAGLFSISLFAVRVLQPVTSKELQRCTLIAAALQMLLMLLNVFVGALAWNGLSALFRLLGPLEYVLHIAGFLLAVYLFCLWTRVRRFCAYMEA